MRYYLKKDALIIRGDFRAAGVCPGGGIKDVRTLLNISSPMPFSEDSERYIDGISSKYGFLQPHMGLITAVPINNLCIAKYDYITAFVTASVSEKIRAFNIIVVCEKPMTDSAILEAICAADEAKLKVISDRKLSSAVLSADGLIIACEHTDDDTAGSLFQASEDGMRIFKSVYQALTEALSRYSNYLLIDWGSSRGWTNDRGALKRKRPTFFIYSRYGGDHWNEWIPEGCPYYPCHNYDRQQCSFCYCPLYPCGDETLGNFIDTPNGAVWSCMDCRFIHIPEVSDHLLRNPEASLAELKAVCRNLRI